ncbi:MAG: hypothetical protein O9284_16660 [Steroidobacteraceae bacterium]|jgi:hypothetical protein|nr:hypothetical protein [Steroidobacteraceae bacterium]
MPKSTSKAASRPATASGRTTPKRRASARARPTAPAAAPASTGTVKLARVAKGKKPQYFADPAIDKLMWITLTLIGELSVARDRLDAVERLLERKRVISVADVDAYEPDAAAEATREARRQAYLDRVLRAVQAELEETIGRDMPRSNADVIAAVAS